jgi:hypothetical protein
MQNEKLRHAYRFMTPLRPGAYFLAPDEEIVTIRIQRVGSTRHGVERAHRRRVLIQRKEISVVLLFYQVSQGKLQRPREVC